MKPLELVVEGFMPFKSQARIDFTGLELFAIQGPTGSGKSSLLDAITYALYGQTDRLGTRGTEALIASGEDHFTLIFTFELSGERYRITRSKGRKATQNQLRLEQFQGERWTLGEQGGVRATEARIRKLLGLDFESFTRAIMLPQGKFDALLRGTKSERQSLLGELTNLGHVAQMYSHAAQQASGLQAELKSKLSLLDAEYESVTQEALGALQTQSRELEEQLLELQDERLSAQQTLARLRSQEATHREYQAAQAARSGLQAQEAQVLAGAKRAQQARSVAHILPLLATSQGTQAAQARAQTEAQVAQARLQASGDAQARLSAALEALQEQQRTQQREQRQQLEHLEQLAQAAPLLRAYQAAEQAHARANTAQAKQVQALEGAQQALEGAQQAQQQAQQAAAGLPELERQASELEQAQALAAKLKQFGGTPKTAHAQPLEWDEQEYFAAREAGRKLDDLRAQLSVITSEKARIAIARQELDTDKQVYQQEQQRLEKLKQDGQNLSQEQQDVAEQWQRSGLIAYHSQLKVGEECPLCGQILKELPALDSFGNTEHLQARLTVLDEHLKARREEYNELRGALRITAKRLEERQQDWEEWQETTLSQEKQYQQELKRFQGNESDRALQYLAGLARKVSQFGPSPAAQRSKVAAQIAALRSEETRTQQALHAAQSAQAAATASLNTAQEALNERRSEAQAALQQLTERLEQLQLSAQQVEAAPDPAAQRRKLQIQAEQLQAQLEQARSAQTQAASAQAAAQATWQAAQFNLEQRGHEAQQAAQVLEQALTALGLGIQQVSEAALPAPDIEELEAALRRHQAQTEQLRAQLAALSEKLGVAPFDAAALKETERSLHATESALDNARQRSGELRHAITDLQSRLERKREYQAQTGELTRQAGLWATLSASLRTSEFQQFLLEDLEGRLLEGAGALLHAISDGRYRLDIQGGEYMVEDLWNGGERRGVKTLSGGETFLASLALAITLSDYLAGNRVLGALFLDEGFGTLDPQALDSVAEALEGLQTQGRMVGVITHVESLSERLPSRLLVSKSVAGSSVTRIDE